MTKNLTPEEEAWVRSKLVPYSWQSVARKMSPRVTAILGYRKTGKTTLATEMFEGKLGAVHNWEYYGRHTPCCDCMSDRLFRPDDRYFRYYLDSLAGSPVVAFGDPLREIVFELLRLPPGYEYDKHKDDPMPEHGGKSVRDYLIRVGEMGRDLPPDPADLALGEPKGGYWAKRALIPYFAKDRRQRVILSDLRFHAEYQAMTKWGHMGDAVTVRLFRSEVEPPPANVESEHDLDDFEPNLILVRDRIELLQYSMAFKHPVCDRYDFVTQI